VAIVVPDRALHARTEPQVLPQAELVDGLLEVAVQLRLTRVRAGPVVPLERERIDVGDDVDLGGGVLVGPPRDADALRLLLDRERLNAGLAQ